MSSISFAFENPWYLLLLIPALAVILTPFFLLPKRRRGGFKRIAPVVLHVVIALLLVLVICGFSVVRNAKDKNVVLLVDLSDSMESVDEALRSCTDSLMMGASAKSPIGIVAFGYDQVYSVEFSGKSRVYELDEVDGAGTDFAAALEYAASLFPDDKGKQIIVLSDGIETDGDAESMARFLATQNIRVDSVYFDTTVRDYAETQISSFAVPENVYVDEKISAIAEIRGNTPCEVVLELYDNGERIKTENLKLEKASQVVEFELEIKEAGLHSYRLVLASNHDTISANNQSYAHTYALGEPSVLVICDSLKYAPSLEKILAEDCTVESCLPDKAPKTVMELCDYDQVILSNVDYSKLPKGYDKLLKTYVEDYGKSLLVAGGTGTYGMGNMRGTKLEEMLPVSFDFRRSTEGKSVAMVLVIDCSRSMTNDNSPNLSVAKQGAIKCVESMTENDQIGLVTFHTDAELRFALAPGTERNKADLTRIISGLTTDSRTYYTEALMLAHEQLRLSDAEVKHIMFLSDGQPKDMGYNQAARKIAADGITLSTIGLGLDSEILKNLSDLGGGRYYYVRSAHDLPDIMLSETQMASANSVVNEVTGVEIMRESKLTEHLGGKELPVLKGFLGTTLKDAATAYLTTEEGHPVYASWDVGKGNVAAFTGDMSGLWTANWFRDDGAKKLLCNMVTTAVTGASNGSSLLVDFEVKGKTTEAVVTSYSAASDDFITLSTVFGNEKKDYILMQTEPGVFRTELETPEAGLYEVQILHTDVTQVMLDHLETSLSVSYSGEYDVFREGGRDLLEKISSLTGGACAEDEREAAKAKAPSVSRYFSPTVLLSVLAMLLFLCDVAIRKLRLKDIQNFLKKFKKAKR